MPNQRTTIHLAGLGLALICVNTAAVSQMPTPGTYRVQVCAEICALSNSSSAIAIATVVIVSDRASLGDSLWLALVGLRPMQWSNDKSAVDNACFSVVRRQTGVNGEEFFFGIQPRARTRSEYSPTVGFSLRVYRSPDAGYSLRWTEPGPLTHGEGWSYGWSASTPYHRNAYFIAKRVGEPDVTQCM
jgi:hypothetical protein